MRAAAGLIALLPLLGASSAAEAAAATAPAVVRPQTIEQCVVHMHRELPREPQASLRSGCTCQLNHIRDNTQPIEYQFWEAQLAIMGDADLSAQERTGSLMRLYQTRNAVGLMSRVADAAEEAINACHLDTWRTTN